MKRKHSKNSDDYPAPMENSIDTQDEESEGYEYSEEQIKKPKFLKRFLTFLIIFCLIIVTVNVGILFFTGKLWFNQPEKNDYPIRGAFVDSDMGEINWSTFSEQNLSLAYIKATKGTSFKDKNFDDNWKQSKKSTLITGAFHVFNLTKSGEKQAKYFCNTLGETLNGRLVPAVEVKLSGIYSVIPPDKQMVINNLTEFCGYIKNKYGVNPVIICNKRSYEKYLSSDFQDFPICMVSLFSQPDENSEWDFWCYNPRVRVKGYENSKEYFSMFVYKNNIDINTFKKKFVC
ncbi:MAG: glycoside hydrolase family 25 protein [Oscillospiraceae bacterium]